MKNTINLCVKVLIVQSFCLWGTEFPFSLTLMLVLNFCFEKNRATSYELKHPPHTHTKKLTFFFFFTACFSFFSAHRWYSDIFNVCWVWIIVSQNILMRNTKNLFNQRKRSDVRLKKICQLLLKRKKKKKCL